MIAGIGTDIAQVSRFSRWVGNAGMIARFFHPSEILPCGGSLGSVQRLCEHYAARFAAKEALSKALGTGFSGMELSDFGIVKDSLGKPSFVLGSRTRETVEKIAGADFALHVSLSHEKEYAVAFVVLERKGE